MKLIQGVVHVIFLTFVIFGLIQGSSGDPDIPEIEIPAAVQLQLVAAHIQYLQAQNRSLEAIMSLMMTRTLIATMGQAQAQAQAQTAMHDIAYAQTLLTAAASVQAAANAALQAALHGAPAPAPAPAAAPNLPELVNVAAQRARAAVLAMSAAETAYSTFIRETAALQMFIAGHWNMQNPGQVPQLGQAIQIPPAFLQANAILLAALQAATTAATQTAEAAWVALSAAQAADAALTTARAAAHAPSAPQTEVRAITPAQTAVRAFTAARTDPSASSSAVQAYITAVAALSHPHQAAAGGKPARRPPSGEK